MVQLNLNEKEILKIISTFIEKQVFCEKLINSGLSFNKGTTELRKKVLVGSQGIITHYPEWRFYFHGNGVRLTNEKTEEIIDYDYLKYLIKGKRKAGGFDAWKLHRFINNQIKIEKLTKKKYEKFASNGYWGKMLLKLEKEKFIKKFLGSNLYVLTNKGKKMIINKNALFTTFKMYHGAISSLDKYKEEGINLFNENKPSNVNEAVSIWIFLSVKYLNSKLNLENLNLKGKNFKEITDSKTISHLFPLLLEKRKFQIFLDSIWDDNYRNVINEWVSHERIVFKNQNKKPKKNENQK